MTANNNTIRLLFTGGGTGGHLFPAIAVADRVKEMLSASCKVEITFVGTKRGIEYRLRETLGYPLYLINMRGIVRSFTLKNLLLPFVIIQALFASWKIIKKMNPHAVIATGGYVCWPVAKAAGWHNIPVLLQEQNSYPGIATRQLAPKAKTIYLGFEGARKHLKTNATIIVSGNPVRPSLQRIDTDNAREMLGLDPNKKTIVILGGSQGARAINNAVLHSLKNQEVPLGYQLLWQTGKSGYKDVTVEAGDKVSTNNLFPFAHDMAPVYSAADFVIARAGALTIAEILSFRIPALYVPYPYAAGDHQKKNAEELVENSLALLLDETKIIEKELLKTAIDFCESSDYLTMRNNIEKYMIGKKPAVDIIADDLTAMLSTGNHSEVEIE